MPVSASPTPSGAAQKITGGETLSSSFRDPSGFLFREEGVLFRQVNPGYRPHYERLLQSRLYDALREAGLLVSHEEVEHPRVARGEAHAILKPEVIPFISYPYEWSFSQLRDAALATLEIQKQALSRGMTLKDASAYNIQFHRGRPILIDTLSFETYEEGRPWVAYRQFCQHFLAPLALMRWVDVRLSQLLRIHIDGVPLDLASRLLPGSTRLRPGLLWHLHLHAGAQRRYAEKAPAAAAQATISRNALLGLLDSLQSAVQALRWEPGGTEWGDYYAGTNYTPEAMTHKKQLVDEFLEAIRPAPRSVWDLGANDGSFSRIAAARGIPTISWDIDPAAVEKNYRESRKNSETNLLPLLQDLTNPSPGLGWAERERASFAERGPAGVVFALALIHHLAISNNVPLGRIAGFFAEVGGHLIIEFVPKSDSQVRRLLSTREDVFPTYDRAHFEAEFGRCFTLLRSEDIPGTERTLYLMRRSDLGS